MNALAQAVSHRLIPRRHPLSLVQLIVGGRLGGLTFAKPSGFVIIKIRRDLWRRGGPIAEEGNTSIQLFPCSTMTNLLAIASRSKAGDEARITHYVRRAWTLVIEAPPCLDAFSDNT
jgi:hypothetical protein